MTNLASYIDVISVRALAESIIMPYANQYSWNWHQAAAIFEYVNDNIRYIPDPEDDDNASYPWQTLDLGGGDCEDQAILVSSLCKAVGIPSRLVLCRQMDASHVLCQVDFGNNETSEIADNLALFYSDLGKPANDGFFWQNGFWERHWMFADTALCRYFGDIQGLVDKGYIDLSWDRTRWSWCREIEIFQVTFLC